MANEINKKTAEQVVEQSTAVEADNAVRELMDMVERLPRTDGMTLPAVGITIIDEETAARMKAIAAINAATDPNVVIDEEGKTLQQVRNEFTYGVTNLDETGAKHTFEVTTDENGNSAVKITAPEVEGQESSSVVIAATPPNIAPIDAGSPTNPVEAREMGIESPSNPAPAVTPSTSTVDKTESITKGTTTASPAVLPSNPTSTGGTTDGGTSSKS